MANDTRLADICYHFCELSDGVEFPPEFFEEVAARAAVEMGIHGRVEVLCRFAHGWPIAIAMERCSPPAPVGLWEQSS